MYKKVIAGILMGVFLLSSIRIGTITVANDSDYVEVQKFWVGFVPLLEQSAKKKKQPLEKVLKQIEGVLTSMLNSPTATEALKKKVAILLELLNKDLAKTSQALSGTQLPQGNAKGNQTNNGYGADEFVFDNTNTNVGSWKDLIDPYVQQTFGDLKDTSLSAVDSAFRALNEGLINEGYSKDEARQKTIGYMEELRQYVVKGSIEGTLNGFYKYKDTRRIIRSSTEGFSLYSVIVNNVGACQGQTYVAILMLNMAGFGPEKVGYKSIPEINHARVEIIGYPRQFDVNASALWRYIEDELNPETAVNLYKSSSSYDDSSSTDSDAEVFDFSK